MTSNTTEQNVQLLTLRPQPNLSHIQEYYGAHFWQPRLREGEVRVGYVATNTEEAPTESELRGLSAMPIVVTKATPLVEGIDLFKKPIRFERIWKEPAKNEQTEKFPLRFYKAIAPPGYKALSHIVTNAADDHGDPSYIPDPEFYCVHEALVQPSGFTNQSVWHDVQSAWNIEGTGFFMFHTKESYPNELQPYALTEGSLFSNMVLTDIEATNPENIDWKTANYYEARYNNESDAVVSHNFEVWQTKSSTISGTWSTTNTTSIENRFGFSTEVAFSYSSPETIAGQLTKTTTFKQEYSQAHRKEESRTVGGGYADTETTHVKRTCKIDVQPEKNAKVTAFTFKAEYSVQYKANLIFHDKMKKKKITIPLTGTFDYKIDGDTIWWKVEDGDFVTKDTVVESGPNA